VSATHETPPQLSDRPSRWRRARVGLAVAAATLVATDQVVQHTLLADGRLRGSAVAPFDPPLFFDGQHAALERLTARVTGRVTGPVLDVAFDPELGWTCPPDGGSGDFTNDWAGCRVGARPLPRAQVPGVTRIVCVGGSFTRGDEVGPLECWPSLVDAAREDVEIANLGVGGFGLDQALMRLVRDGLPLEPDEVWLGLMPQAALRVTNLYRPTLRHYTPSIAFKPRYRLDDTGRLELVPCPVQRLADVPPLFASQARFLGAVGHDDLWIERARAAYLPRGAHWMHYLASTRILLTLHERSRRAARDWIRPDGELEPEVEALIVAIIRRARETAEAAGARFRLLVLPSRGDLAEESFPGGVPYWSDLVADDAGDVIDLSGILRAAGVTADDASWMPAGHWAPATHQRVAAELLARLPTEH